MKLYFQYLLFLFIVIGCAQKINGFTVNNSCVLFDSNKPCWCPNEKVKKSYRINEANACKADKLSGIKINAQKIEQYVLLNDLSIEEEQDFKTRAENNELTIEELKILDAIIIDKQEPRGDEGPICRKRGCPYYKCFRRKNCTCC